jgi:hypothetical protein
MKTAKKSGKLRKKELEQQSLQRQPIEKPPRTLIRCTYS